MDNHRVHVLVHLIHMQLGQDTEIHRACVCQQRARYELWLRTGRRVFTRQALNMHYGHVLVFVRLPQKLVTNALLCSGTN